MLLFLFKKTYYFTNVVLTILGIIYYIIHKYSNIYLQLLYYYFKNILIIYILDIRRNRINYNNLKLIEFIPDLTIGYLIEIMIINLSYYNYNYDNNILIDFITFIPKTFVFEIIFDFFHYCMHRLLHTKHFYFIHKKHHKYKSNITVINTFHHNPIDLILSNLLPMIITSYLIYITQLKILILNEFQFIIFLIYKTFIELAGHVGIDNKTPSFPQLNMLPKYFNIEMYSTDHYNHHTKFNYNYSKRFILWDKLFNTYYK